MKYIDAEKLYKYLEYFSEFYPRSADNFLDNAVINVINGIKTFIASLQQEQEDMGEVSDGYHTFNELYYYRMLYNAAFFNLLPKEWVHKSKRHHTGEECFGGGWFIVMANLPTGQVSNHYELKDWDLFKVPEKEVADEWDGHTPQETADRLCKYLQQEQPNNMIQWTGHNLKEVIDFTGKSPKFGEWFKSWDELESYVHSHGNILKLFSDDGSHFEVPVGAWIVKTPDGYNVPSVARYIHIKQEHPQLPGIEDPGIPGKDFIPVEWVDACEMYGKWKIVKQEQPEVDLEEAARHVYESWMGGTMDDVRRDMAELGKVLNARKEE